MRAIAKLSFLVILLPLLGCTDRAGETDSGGVLLEVEFVTAVFQVGVEQTTVLSLDSVRIDSVVANPTGGTSQLMDVNVDLIEVTYTRADAGTRTPPPFLLRLVGKVPVGGSLNYTNLPVMIEDQTRSPPLSDLLFVNGGVDQETGNDDIRIDLTVRIFGRTLTGIEVVSEPRSQTFVFVPSLGTGT